MVSETSDVESITLFLVLAQDLNTLSGNNELIKFADDSTLLVPEKTDVSVKQNSAAYRMWLKIIV